MDRQLKLLNSKGKLKVVFLGVIALFTLGIGSSLIYTPKDYLIQMTASGYSPSNLVIPQGSRVTFRSVTGQPFWPASNFHPTHEIYPEFDPRKEIPPGGSWSFTFSEVGTFRFHDHLNPAQTGTITVSGSVLGQLFGVGDPCLNPTKNSASYNQRVRCWQKEIDQSLKTKGLGGALKTFAAIYDREPAFASACHDMTHLLGEAAFREFSRTGKAESSDLTARCSYGFYHGFIEAMLHQGLGYGKVLEYCQAVREELSRDIVSPSAYTRCFHGIGHGAFDTLNSSLWGKEKEMIDASLAVCTSLAKGDETLLYSCAKGVFNALTNAYVFKNYDLKPDPASPVGICQSYSAERIRTACYLDVGLFAANERKLDYASALKYLASVIPEEKGLAEAVLARVSQEVQLSPEVETTNLVTACQGFSVLVREHCLSGIIEGIFIAGKPETESARALELCRDPSLSSDDKRACYDLLYNMIYTALPRDQANESCSQFPPAFQTNCRH